MLLYNYKKENVNDALFVKTLGWPKEMELCEQSAIFMSSHIHTFLQICIFIFLWFRNLSRYNKWTEARILFFFT